MPPDGKDLFMWFLGLLTTGFMLLVTAAFKGYGDRLTALEDSETLQRERLARLEAAHEELRTISAKLDTLLQR